MPKISIVIIVYNTEQYLHQCLDSAVGQSLKDIEIVVVNDRSPGNCREIVEEYQKNDARIKYIEHETNKGSFAARQTGILAASGEFTRFLDSDDWLDLEACAIIYNTLQRAGADMLYHGTQYRYEAGEKQWAPPIPTNGYEELEKAALLDQIFKYRYNWDKDSKFHASCCFTFRTSTIQNTLKEWGIQKRLLIYEDFLATVGFICSSHKCVSIDKKLYYYRIGSGISSVKLLPEPLISKIRDMRYIFEKTREILLSKNLWTQQYEYRVTYEYLHIFHILQSAGPQYLKRFFSLLNPDEFPILISIYLDIKKCRGKHLLSNRRFYAGGIKKSWIAVRDSMLSLVLSLLNKFLQITGIGKKF